ncbi:MAG: hypothetical protein IJP29_03860 [Lachnospiraceae bacterium]|nr:hypothetical protein [Lachnospiraceae bacterium]
MNTNLKNIIQIPQDKKEKVIIFFLLGVFFLLIGTPLSSSKKSLKEEGATGEKQGETTDLSVAVSGKNVEKDAYIEQLENKLEQTIAGMEGAGEVLVMITLKNSGEKILDKNQPYESSSEIKSEEGVQLEQTSMKSDQETVLIEEEGNTLPIVVQELYPEIEGVVVVCEGGDNSELALRIKEAVQALFSVDTHKIVVCKLRQ